MKIKNTLPFNPAVTTSFPTFEPSEVRGQVLITDGEATKGSDIIEHIKSNKEDTFIVSKFVFEHLKPLGYKNICMFDPALTEYGTLPNGKEGATAQGGLIFA